MKTRTKTFKREDIKNAAWEDTDENYPLMLEHKGKWVADGKYQYQECILRDMATGLYYIFNVSRSGSPFTDYEYDIEYAPDEIELTEVVKSTKAIVVWIPVKG